MRSFPRAVLALVLTALMAVGASAPAFAEHTTSDERDFMSQNIGAGGAWKWSEQSSPHASAPAGDLRVATYNVALNRAAEGDLVSDLTSPNNAQAQAVAEVIQRTNPDVVLLNEFDYDEGHEAAGLFRDNYLAAGQNGQDGVSYPYMYTAPSNTGVPIGADLDGDGTVGGAADSFGFGDFPGQFGMVLYSKYPILQDQVRTFQGFLWKDMPNNLMPAGYYGPLVRNVFRLSSKSHWDVPVDVHGETVHLVAAHPTPPVFDGAERRNARRNHDEIRLLNDYVAGGRAASYIYDDSGKTGGLRAGERFVVLGDLNADPVNGDSYRGAVNKLLANPDLTDPLPSSNGAAARVTGTGSTSGAPELLPKDTSNGAAPLRTADFSGSAGPLRVDYVLPSRTLAVGAAGVFWPAAGEDGADLVDGTPSRTSDHRLVWVDVGLSGS